MRNRSDPLKYMSKKYDGKVVTKLKYHNNNADTIIPIRLHEDTRKVEDLAGRPYRGKGSKPRETTGVAFRIYLEEVNLPVDEKKGHTPYIESTDINVLFTEIIGRLDKQHELEWEEWLVVNVSEGYSHHTDGEAKIELSWESIWIVQMPDGRTLHRTSHYRHDRIEEGWPRTDVDKREEGNRSKAIIRATDENVAALEALAERISDTRRALMMFLCPKAIEENLAKVGQRLLPATEIMNEPKGK